MLRLRPKGPDSSGWRGFLEELGVVSMGGGSNGGDWMGCVER